MPPARDGGVFTNTMIATDIAITRRADTERKMMAITQAEIEAAAKAFGCDIYSLNGQQLKRALEAAASARQEPKGCPTPGACSCLTSPQEQS
jgi:hypothetical protein